MYIKPSAFEVMTKSVSGCRGISLGGAKKNGLLLSSLCSAALFLNGLCQTDNPFYIKHYKVLMTSGAVASPLYASNILSVGSIILSKRC